MNYELLKSAIAEVIKANGNNEITGNLLQSVLLTMVETLGEGYRFAGVADGATIPQNSDALLFYIAEGKGTYPNFNLSVDWGEAAIFFKPINSGVWYKQSARVMPDGYTLYSDTIQDYSSLPAKPAKAGKYFILADRVYLGYKYRYLYTSDPDENGGAWTQKMTLMKMALAVNETSAAGHTPEGLSLRKMLQEAVDIKVGTLLKYQSSIGTGKTFEEFYANALTQAAGDLQALEDIAQNGYAGVFLAVDDEMSGYWALQKIYYNSNNGSWHLYATDGTDGITISYDGINDTYGVDYTFG